MFYSHQLLNLRVSPFYPQSTDIRLTADVDRHLLFAFVANDDSVPAVFGKNFSVIPNSSITPVFN